MTTLVNLKCGHRKCHQGLTLIRTFSDGDKEFICSVGHRTTYSVKYLGRFDFEPRISSTDPKRSDCGKCPFCDQEALPGAEGWYCNNCDTKFDSRWQPVTGPSGAR